MFSRSTRGRGSIARSRKDREKKESKLGTVKAVKKSPDSKEGSLNSKSQSRLNRPARTIKITKSKQSKSIFTFREEDPNPESLNCAHYEKLMRIHVMLAMIERDQEPQIQHALDAKQFIVKIFEISFKTLNQQKEKAAKYAMDQDSQPIQALPRTAEEWIHLQFSREAIEKANSYEDYDFISVFVFDKAELTFVYAQELLKILESLGMAIHALPVHVFLRFLAKEIIKNSTLAVTCELRFCRCLRALGFEAESSALMQSLIVAKLRLTEHEKRLFLAKAEASKVTKSQTSPSFLTETAIKPNLVKAFPPHEMWYGLACELLLALEVSRAKEYFE